MLKPIPIAGAFSKYCVQRNSVDIIEYYETTQCSGEQDCVCTRGQALLVVRREVGGGQPEGVLLQPRPAAPVPSQVEVDVVADVANIILLSYIRAVNEPSRSFTYYTILGSCP